MWMLCVSTAREEASVTVAPLFLCQMPMVVAALCAMAFPDGAASQAASRLSPGASVTQAAPQVWLNLTPGAAMLNFNDPHTRDRIARDCASGRPTSPDDCAQLDALRRHEASQQPGAPERGGVAPPPGLRWPTDTGFPPAGGRPDAMPFPCAPANPCQR